MGDDLWIYLVGVSIVSFIISPKKSEVCPVAVSGCVLWTTGSTQIWGLRVESLSECKVGPQYCKYETSKLHQHDNSSAPSQRNWGPKCAPLWIQGNMAIKIYTTLKQCWGNATLHLKDSDGQALAQTLPLQTAIQIKSVMETFLVGERIVPAIDL